uniref:Protein mono-ADP-ribosyltransferase TIPARP-like isoform X2 n=1 Tax=Geotrypetes seraphini TaxID=260995 RepID=A0A6P8Q2J3_GEOSA|nr:protein mono-ADP-ribosyltransferase TIPARP-like isoform X2 [Geotrypetes seraphini]
MSRPTKRRSDSHKCGQDPSAGGPLPSKKVARIPAGKASDPEPNKLMHSAALVMCTPRAQEAHSEQQERPKCAQQCWEVGGPSTHQSVFHTNPLDGIPICDNFLLGTCEKGSLCSLHHTLRPYHWQLREKATQQWMSLGGCAEEHLERRYCNLEDDATLTSSNGSSWVLNLDTLNLTSHWVYDKVRRLSNTSDPGVNPYFPTEWSVYWKDEKRWVKYETIALELEGAFQKGMWNHAFRLKDRLYNADLKRFTQTNIKTKYKRGLRHRPTFQWHMELVPYLRTISAGESVVHGICPPGAVPVASSEAAFARISSCFHQTLSRETSIVCAIYRLNNKRLLQKYRSQKTFMNQGLTVFERRQLEKKLYHGTDEQSVTPICQMNFDPRVSGTNGTCFGQGSYFACKASYSHRFTRCGHGGHRYMFLAKVLVGKAAPGISHYRRPPALGTPDGALYESCVDNLSNPQLFVVFDSCQCYPDFLICYKMLADPIIVDE